MVEKHDRLGVYGPVPPDGFASRYGVLGILVDEDQIRLALAYSVAEARGCRGVFDIDPLCGEGANECRAWSQYGARENQAPCHGASSGHLPGGDEVFVRRLVEHPIVDAADPRGLLRRETDAVRRAVPHIDERGGDGVRCVRFIAAAGFGEQPIQHLDQLVIGYGRHGCFSPP